MTPQELDAMFFGGRRRGPYRAYYGPVGPSSSSPRCASSCSTAGWFTVDRIEVGCRDNGEPIAIVVLEDSGGQTKNVPLSELEGARVRLGR